MLRQENKHEEAELADLLQRYTLHLQLELLISGHDSVRGHRLRTTARTFLWPF
jgi:hypothetical protein